MYSHSVDRCPGVWHPRASEKAQTKKVYLLPTKPDDLSSIPGMHTVEETNSVKLSSYYTHAHSLTHTPSPACMHMCTHTHPTLRNYADSLVHSGFHNLSDISPSLSSTWPHNSVLAALSTCTGRLLRCLPESFRVKDTDTNHALLQGT